MIDTSAVDADHAPPVRLCPRCDQRLAGPAPDGECPACGLPFDARSETWPAKSLRAHRVSIAGLVVAVGASVAMGLTRGDSLSWGLAGLFCLGLVSHVGWHFATRRWRLSVGPAGILIRKGRTQLLTSDQLRPVDQWRWSNQIPVHSSNAVRSVGIFEFLPDRAAVSSFRQSVRERHSRDSRIPEEPFGRVIIKMVGDRRYKGGILMRRLVLWIALLAPAASAQVATFRSLGHLPGRTADSRATAVSADGRVVVGGAGYHPDSVPFRWTQEEGMVELGPVPPDSSGGNATGISADGSLIIGNTYFNGSGNMAYTWTRETGWTPLFTGGGPTAIPHGISADGRTIVGDMSTSPGYAGFVWSADSGLTIVENVEIFWAVSDDGSTAAGAQSAPVGWSRETGRFSLDSFGGGGAFCLSADGSVIAGYAGADGTGEFQGFRWTAETGMVALGDLAGGDFSSRIHGMSADGEILVGTGNGATDALIWNRHHGLRSLRATLQNIFHLDLTNWYPMVARAITPDGRTIVGYGQNPAQQLEAFVVTLPRPNRADVVRNYAVDLADLSRLLTNFGVVQGAVHSDGDIDLDGDVDFYDLTELLSEFGTICE